MQLIEGQSVKEHNKVMIEMFNELALISDNITDENRVIYLLASLLESYEMLVTALEAIMKMLNFMIPTTKNIRKQRT